MVIEWLNFDIRVETNWIECGEGGGVVNVGEDECHDTKEQDHEGENEWVLPIFEEGFN